MIRISSESQNIFEFIERNNYPLVTLDIETLDSKQSKLWNEPIISFSLSFVSSSKPTQVLDNFPTFCFGISDTKKEFDLLSLLREIFSRLPKNTVIVGHNISPELKCKKIEGWHNYEGYDIPKILKRGELLSLNMSIIKKFNVYDTLQVAYDILDHTAHGIKYKDIFSGKFKIKKILKSEELEKILNIQRPKDIPKLGSDVRIFFKNKKYREILLYNSSDTIVESIFYRIFESQSSKNRCQISFKNLPIIDIGRMEIWKKLIA